MSTKERLKSFIDYLDSSISSFEKTINASNGYVNSISKGIGSDKLELILEKFPQLNLEWLLTGRGEMIKNEKSNSLIEPHIHPKITGRSRKGIPLIPIEAMAGYGNGPVQVMEYDTESFVVPTFKGADYLIGVRGSSMYPKYNSGDIVACKHLALDTFFQWNKVYVLDTVQGALIKRVCKGNTEDHISIVSDNPKFEPFQLHRSEINAIAIVMGVIRLE